MGKLDLNKYDLNVSSKECNSPKYVYIPLMNHTNFNCDLLVNVGDYVTIGSKIGKRDDHFKLDITSSVSGKVVEIKEIKSGDNREIKCVVIENDYKDTYVSNDEYDTYNYSKKEVIDLLKSCSVTGMGGSDFPTYVKYNTDEKIKYLLINAVECEAYLNSDKQLMKTYLEETLIGISSIMKIFEIEKAYIVIKKNKVLKAIIEKSISNFNNIVIKEVNNYYPAGYERNVILDTLNVTYDKLPIEKNIVVNNITTMYLIYNALKYRRSVDKRLISIVNLNNNTVDVKLVKIGTLIEEIITKEDNDMVISGGPMMGNIVDTSFPLVKNVGSFVITKDNPNICGTCLRCSKCALGCPVKLSPVTIKDNLNNPSTLKKLEVNKCVSCGYCSYVCPARLKLRDLVKDAIKVVNDEK